MSSRNSLYARIARRETHSPRSTLAITLAVVVILSCGYLGAEIILDLLGQPALLVAPTAMVAALIGLPGNVGGMMVVPAIVVTLISMVLIVLAFKAGRRPRHALKTDRTVTIVDDEVIASALARHASNAGYLAPDNARVSVSRSLATVHLTPTSGTPVDRQAVTKAVLEELSDYELIRQLQTTIVIHENGEVGA